MRMQNEKLKTEFMELKAKLEECIEKARHKRRQGTIQKIGLTEEEQSTILYLKEIIS